MTANAARDGPRDRRPDDGLAADDADDDDDARSPREATPASELRRVMPIMDRRTGGASSCAGRCADARRLIDGWRFIQKRATRANEKERETRDGWWM